MSLGDAIAELAPPDSPDALADLGWTSPSAAGAAQAPQAGSQPPGPGGGFVPFGGPYSLGQAASQLSAPTPSASSPPPGAGAPVGIPYPGAPGAAPAPRLDPRTALQLAQQGQAQRPAGWVPQSRTQTGVQYSPETLSAVGQGLASSDQLAGAQLDYEAAAGGAQSDAQKIANLYDQTQALEDQTRRNQQSSELGAYQDHLESLMRDADEAGKIDPNRFWHEKSTGQRIGLAVAAALGGAGAALTHTQNGALALIQQAMDNDLKAQVEQAKNKRATVGEVQSLYQMQRERFGDDERAALATSAAQRQVLASELQSSVSDASAPQAMRLRALQLMNGVNAQKADILQKLDEKTSNLVTSEKYREPGGGSSVLDKLKNASAIQDQMQKLYGQAPEQRQAEANVAKTLAETQGTEQKNAQTQGGALAGIGNPPSSTNPVEHPLNFLASLAPSSHIAIDRDRYKAAALQAIHQSNTALRSPELLEKMSKFAEPHIWDSDDDLRFRWAELHQMLGGAPAVGVPKGVEPDEAP